MPGKGSQYNDADNQYVKARMKKADFNKKEWVQVTSPRLRTQRARRHHHLCGSPAYRLSSSNHQNGALPISLSGTLPAYRRVLSGGE